MIGAVITRGLGFAAWLLITDGLAIGEAPEIILPPPPAMFRGFGGGQPRTFVSPATAGQARLFGDGGPAGGAARIFK